MEDIEKHAAWMEAENYAATTISSGLGIIAAFYRWCDERQIDPECEAGFNPEAGVRRPKRQHFAGAQLLSRGEVAALLNILEQDDSALGKRDYAFILARLRTGVALKTLQQLRWGQIEQDEEGALPHLVRDRLRGSCGTRLGCAGGRRQRTAVGAAGQAGASISLMIEMWLNNQV